MVYAQGEREPVENAGAAAEADAEDRRATAAGRWPFQRLCGQLLLDVLHAQWEVRPTPCLAALSEILGANCVNGALPVVWQEGGVRALCQLCKRSGDTWATKSLQLGMRDRDGGLGYKPNP